MEEIWKDIKGYEGLYQVSNYGRVKSFKHNKEKLRKEVKDNMGYLIVNLSKNGNKKIYKIHRLVAEAFLQNPNNYPQVNHKDENKINNRADNLEWCTAKYNSNYGTRNERMSNTKKEKYPKGNHYMNGRHHTEETKKKIRENQPDISFEKHPQAKKVVCLTTNEKFNCIKTAALNYNICATSISQCCKGKRKSAGKHPLTKERLVWRYYDE